MALERLQKFLARAGLASRRAAEEWIRAGKVTVNGRAVTELGAKIDPERDQVRVEGRLVRLAPPVTVILHKPYGYLSTTTDPLGRRVVTGLLGEKYGRLYPVGRLDYDATGLLILSNEGELAYRLMHPRYQVPRTYRVTVTGEVPREILHFLAGGVEVDGRPVPAEVKVLKRGPEKTVLELTVREGRYHLVKRLLEKVGHPVMKLKRIAFGPLHLGRLPRGAHRPLTPMELKALRAAAGLK
jgi:23S rRNA pseudouridine2605 synthase